MRKRVLGILLVAVMLVMTMTASAMAVAVVRPTLNLKEGDKAAWDCVDKNTTTKWSSTSGSSVIFQASSSFTPNGYSISTCTDSEENPGLNPKSWRLLGSNDYGSSSGYSWYLLDEVTNDKVLQDKNEVKYNFYLTDVPTSYKYYWLQVNTSNGDEPFQLSEFSVWQCAHDYQVTGNVPATEDEGSYLIKKCSECGREIIEPDVDTSIGLTLTDKNGGGWDGAELQIHRNGEYWRSVTMKDRGTTGEKQVEKISLPYSDEYCYSFFWQKGRDDYNNELYIDAPNITTNYYYGYGLSNSNSGDRLLRFNRGDYSAVTAAKNNVPADLSIYTEESVKAVRDAIDAVDDNLPGAQQATINAMAKAIEDAVIALEPNSKDSINMTGATTDLYITETGYRWGSGEETAYTGTYCIGGSVNGIHIVVESGSHDIVIYELHLYHGGTSDKPPLRIKNGASVRLTLNGNNTLKNNADNKIAALNVEEGASLEITESSTGTLETYSKYRGAGIGGNEGEGAGSITIRGGAINSTSGFGAAIGIGKYGTGTCTVTINGGYVEASSKGGAAIGSGLNSNCTNIAVISGGTVIANSRDTYGIGRGDRGSGKSVFSTGENGNAVIFTSGIEDKSGRDNWSGIIFAGSDNGDLYGSCVTPTDDFVIESGKTLTIGEDRSLVISEGVTMTSEGTINNSGKIYVDGTFKGNADNVYYPLTRDEATAEGSISDINERTYGKAGGEISVTANEGPEYCAFDSWISDNDSVKFEDETASATSFIMPASAVKVRATYKSESHSFTEYTSNDDATCTTDGTETSICDNGCGITDTRTEKDTALGHDFGEWTEIQSSSCVDKGSEQRICKRCRLTETRDVPASGHTWDDDYTIDQEATCTEDGSKSIHCQKCKAVKDSQVIPALCHKYKYGITKATTSKNGSIETKCSVCGHTETSDITRPHKLQLKTTSFVFNGASKKPGVVVKDAEGKTIPAEHYMVTYSAGRKNVGRYKVTVKFKDTSDRYTGSKYAYFYINPRGTSISKTTGAKKAFTVKWKKQSSKMSTSRISGYQIRYSTSSKMTSAKTKTVKGYKCTSKKITKLKAKKRYYVQVRTYKTVGGRNYYSAWSKGKAVRTK